MSGEPEAKRSTMSALEQLKEMTVIVADTGDFEGKQRKRGLHPGLFHFPKFQMPINRLISEFIVSVVDVA